MNRNDLKTKLAAQRRWREQQTIQQPKSPLWQGQHLLAVNVFILFLIAIGILFFFPISKADEYSTPTVITPTKIVPFPTVSINIAVCVENLHVRFFPNGDVRGYLKSGEKITPALDQSGESIVQVHDGENWLQIVAPITGWVNQKYLCKKGE